VLDYGCGYGDLTYAISRTHPVRGVDPDPARVQFAAEQYAPVTFAVCNPARLDFPDASFDIVTSTVVIHFAGDPIGHLREIHRVLRPGGHLVITVQNSPVLWNRFRGLLGKSPAPSSLWVPTRETFHEILRRQGFQIEMESHFYDPPTDGSWNLRGLPLTVLQQLLSMFRVRATCSYYTIVAERNR
jgi:ubiquinone/menaquinone biosynthesis C-methylase UbiE